MPQSLPWNASGTGLMDPDWGLGERPACCGAGRGPQNQGALGAAIVKVNELRAGHGLPQISGI